MGTRDTYAPLPAGDAEVAAGGHRRWRPLCAVLLLISAVVLIVVTLAGQQTGVLLVDQAAEHATSSRGPESGVSEKKSGVGLHAEDDLFPWSDSMLRWQRTGFHYQPENNYMSDPSGPIYYKGWYHIFYQHNADHAFWGNIAWGHAASRDLIHWRHLPTAISPDQWYDINGDFTGSITILPDGNLVMLYTCCINNTFAQIICLAVPTEPNDPLLTNWTKYEGNPVIYPPPDIGKRDFRDPTTTWYNPSDKTWRVVIGSKDVHHAGIAMTYKTKDFIEYELLPGVLHRREGTGMWECMDIYPINVNGTHGIHMEEAVESSKEVTHVLKASFNDEWHDYYELGWYDAAANTWTTMDPDVGLTMRYDWGKYYASRTFYDPAKQRRVLWGYVGEVDSERADIAKGWASLQTIPRTVNFDTKTRTNVLLWPVEEVEMLRTNTTELSGITMNHGSVVPLNLSHATQLDILAEFQLDPFDVAAASEADVGYNCSTSGGAAGRGALGPFGLLVLADVQYHTEQTAVFFYVARELDGRLTTHFCQDETQSSRANDIVKRVVGNVVPVLDGETLSVRVLVDHSIVESFAQGGRSIVTSRVYPTVAIYDNAGVYLFNNSTSMGVTAKNLVVHEMKSC